jgi:2-aminoadipate transaminase
MGFGYHGEMDEAPGTVTFDSRPAAGVVNLGIGQPSPDLMPVDLLRSAADGFLDRAAPLDLNYGERQGDAGFRSALADFLTRNYGHPASADSLLATGGISQALDFVCEQLTQPGDTVLVEEPTYFLAHRIFADHGLQVAGITMDEAGLRPDHLAELISVHSPTMLYTIPSYHNPTGRTLSAERRREVLRLSREHDFVVVADEVYQMLNYFDEPPPAFGTMIGDGNVVSLGSFSKIMAPALRLGWIQAGDELLDRLLTSGLINSGGSLNHFTSLIMREAIQSGRQQDWLSRLRPVYSRRAEAMDEALGEHLAGRANWRRPGGGYFFWLDFGEGFDTARLKPRAAEYGTGFQPGSVFSCRGEQQQFLRLSFAHYRSHEIRAAVAGLARLMG